MEEVQILQLDPVTFETQTYKASDENLITTAELDTVFSSSSDYIEYYIYDENQNLIYPFENQTVALTSYSVKEGDVLLDPQKDLQNLGFDLGVYNILYTFYRRRLGSTIERKYYIREISSDRTELRLDSNDIENRDIIETANRFISYREQSTYFVDFYLNFGANRTLIANNLRLDTTTADDPTILIKLYDPLPDDIELKDTLWVVEELSTPQAYQVNFPFIPTIEEDFTFLSGPNFNLDVKSTTGNSGQLYSYNTLLSTNLTSSQNQIKNILNSKGIDISIDYENFSEFVNFSSAKTRLENFYYKVGLIESYTNSISASLGAITSDTTSSLAYSSSIAVYESQIQEIINNFDGYENFLYYDSGSLYSYPKVNNSPPYILYSTGSSQALNWVGSATEGDPYYGGMALSASNYDQNNSNWLHFAIPEYLREDPDNVKYELFVDMVGQHYDNIWVYTKDITNRFNADNRLDYGISKDLVADAIRDFGVKLYSNNFNTEELYTAFLGLTPSGSLFPFPDITDTLPAPSGSEYIDAKISASNDAISLDGVNKRLYKKLYHNLPYLLKTKGTIAGLRALVTSYGIPDTILRISEFGGKDRNNALDWDYTYNQFNYALDFDGTNYLTSSFNLNDNFSTESPKTLQFRFKTKGIPTGSGFDHSYQTLWIGNSNTAAILLEYTQSLTSGSYDGSIQDEYKYYGTLKFLPEAGIHPYFSASVSLPFFDGGWWSVMATLDYSSPTASATLRAANKIDNDLGFTGSNVVTHGDIGDYWNSIVTSSFPNYQPVNYTLEGITYKPFSGSLQEIRYYTDVLSGSLFYDYTVNPFSFEGNTINSAPDTLAFRADLGTLLNTGSRTSVHPKVTGSSAYITSSFENDSSFYINQDTFIVNKEYIAADQPAVGIKNRITDKIQVEDHILPSGDTLSPYRSIQQTSYVSQSYTPNINYLEVAFSPQNEINDDIIAQMGYFNVGDYIGDPRQISQSTYSYPDLDTLRDAYFNKYINSYNLVDFVRLIKFFDNSLFKMIKDFTPARTSLSSGVVIKQHLLERNRQRPALVSYTDVTYTGSIKPQSRNYDTGSGDVGQYEYVSGSSIYRFSGGTGGSTDRYNGLHTSPSASAYGLTNRFNLTQSYSESFDGPAGPREVTNFNQNEFYNGIFSGSTIVATTRSLNPGCDPYLRVADLPIQYFPIFFNDIISPIYGGTVTKDDWANPLNSPLPGYAWILTQQDTEGESLGLATTYIKLARLDYNGVDVADYIGDSNRIEFIFPESGEGTEYYINGFVVHPNHVILTISQDLGDYRVTGSVNGGSENWSLIARGNYTSSTTNDYSSQGDFTRLATSQTQYFKYWNGVNQDALGFFNSSSFKVFTQIDLSDDPSITNADYYSAGTYNPLRTTNLPWVISASIHYSASDTGFTAPEAKGRLINGGVYTYIGYEDQQFTIDSAIAKPGVISGSYSLSTRDAGFDIVDGAFFNLNVNNSVPGYKYPGAIAAGNRQVKEPGTASLDFEFDSIQFNAVANVNPAFDSVPLSGSALRGSNTNFDPYAGFVSGSNGTALVSGSYFVSASTDGIYRLNYGEVDAVYNLDTLENINFSITINFDILTVPSNVPLPFTTPKLDLLKSTDGVTYTAVATRFFSTIGSYSLSYVDTSTYNKSTMGSRYFKLRFSHHTGELEYDLTQWRVDVASANNTINLIDSNYQQVNPGDSDGNISLVGEYYNFKTRAKLMYTGSNGDPAREITSSNAVTFSSLFTSSLHTINFPDSPILGIFDDNPASNSNTINTSQSLYYVEYEVFDWELSSSDSLTITPLNYTPYPQVFITNSIAGGGDTYDLTGYLQVYHGNADNFPLNAGEGVFSLANTEFIVPTSESTGVFNVSGIYQGPFDYNDTFRMGVSVNRNYLSGLTITQYTMSIWPTSSVLATVNEGASQYGVAVYGQEVYGGTGDPIAPGYNNYAIPTLTDLVVPSFFNSRNVNVLPFSLALDCQPLLNNYLSARSSSFLMDVDYNIATGSITPVNLAQILDNSAVKADVPDSNYTAKSMILPRYEGSKSTSKLYNLWSYTDEGTYGQLPTVELRKAYIGYFDGVDDPYPLYNDVTRINLTYLVDLAGNALPPSLDKSSKAILEKVFTQDEGARVAALSGSSLVKELNDLYKIERLGGYPTPIMYTQTSSNGFSNYISLTSSRRFDRFDIKETTGVEYFRFAAFGTASATSFPATSFSQDLDPTERIRVASTATDPYTTGGGIIDFPGVTVGNEVQNTQRINLETSVITSFLYEGNNAKVNLKLSLLSGSTYISPQIEDVRLRVYKDDDTTQDLGSLIDISRLYSSQGDIINFIGATANKKLNTVRSTNYASKTNSTILNRQNQIEIEINATALNKYLQNKGVYRGGSQKAQNNPLNIVAHEFTLVANSGVTTFKGGDNIKWNLTGTITGNSTKTRTTTFNQFYPSILEARYFPTKISMQGALDHLFPTEPASAPFWIYSGSISGSTSSPARPVQPTELSGGKILVMSASVINDFYGVESYQGQLPYVLGPSEYFPDGVERKGSSMGPVRYPIEIKENDEIRFGNNENYTYRIVKVYPPQQNVEYSSSISETFVRPRLKIELDRPVPADVNKDFFLIRRFIPDANSIYLNVPFPWKIPPSASSSPGIIFPEFPTIELEQSASSIVTNLVSKGIVK